MAFLISGLVLFHSEENFVDLTIVNMFLAVEVEDPTPTLLTYVYYTIHLCHEKSGGMML